jgi:TatD DNase family protein
MLIDSHAHLFYEDYKEDLHSVLLRAQEAGVRTIVVPGTNLETSKLAIELAERYSFVYAAVGIHPHEAINASDELLKEIAMLCTHKRVVAIGEIGLDYHYDFSPREMQMQVFRKQLEIAVQSDLPIIVHTRESMDESIELVADFSSRHPSWRAGLQDGSKTPHIPRGVFHCFMGNVEQVRRLNDAGFYCSYPGIVTFKNSPVLATLQATGFGNILLETDSPYLSPVPHRGKRNEPAHVTLIAERVAALFEVPLRDIADATTANACRLFQITV